MNELKLTPIEKNEQRLLTTAQLAEAYGTDTKVITKNFNRNKERYIEGVHFYRLTGSELKKFFANVKLTFANSNKIRELYLWTEKGALLHAKSLNTDKAWEVYDFLVDTYFRARQMETVYNEAILKILENQEEIKKKLDNLEIRMDRQEKQQDKFRQYIKKELLHIRKDTKEMFDNALGENNHVMIPMFTFVCNEISDKHNEVVKIVRNLISYYFER